MTIPSFEEWFEAKYRSSFDDRYCQPNQHPNYALMAHIRHSREYMQEQLQAIADMHGVSGHD